MKINYFVLIAFAFVINVACKKESKTPMPDPVAPVTPAADGTPSSATQFYGIFTTGTYTSVQIGQTPSSYPSARAYFSNMATPGVYMASAVRVNAVYLNNDSLTYNTSYKYFTNFNLVNLASETWSVNGANGIGTFSFTNNAVDPGFTGANTLPDSVSLSTGFSININNVTNATDGMVSIFDALGGTCKYSVALNNGNNAITITAANLSSANTSTNGVISIALTNKKAFVFSSKDYQFIREAQYNKHIKIKP